MVFEQQARRTCVTTLLRAPPIWSDQCFAQLMPTHVNPRQPCRPSHAASHSDTLPRASLFQLDRLYGAAPVTWVYAPSVGAAPAGTTRADDAAGGAAGSATGGPARVGGAGAACAACCTGAGFGVDAQNHCETLGPAGRETLAPDPGRSSPSVALPPVWTLRRRIWTWPWNAKGASLARKHAPAVLQVTMWSLNVEACTRAGCSV